MRDLPTQASMIVGSVLMQAEQLAQAGVPAERIYDACLPGVIALLSQFQDDLLDAQREAGIALAQALNLMGKR